jgi:DNA-binding SARP family transcriptional activator
VRADVPGTDTLRFRDLGSVDVAEDGQARAPGGPILGRLLARLLVDPGRRVDVSALADAVWGDRGAARSQSTLDSHLHRLRRFLDPDRDQPGRGRDGPSGRLVLEAGGYHLAVGGDHVDSVRFAVLTGQAAELLTAGAAGQAVQRAEQARALWRGRPWSPWSDEPWAAAAVARLEELNHQLTETLVDALLASAQAGRALAELEPVLAAGPLRERPWEQYLLAAAQSGRVEDALAAYRRADRLFRDELGVEPGAELRRLQQLVLAGKVAPVSGRLEVPAARAAGDLAERQPPGRPEVHLPRRRTRLIGRDREMADLAARLRPAATVTVVGTGGAGKTTLAVAVAEQVVGQFPGGVWFVDLSSVLDAEQVAEATATALGLSGDGTGTAAGALRAFTRARQMLLILDNCEHVLDPAAELVEELQVPGAQLTVLATSREPLEVDGEELLELAPLVVSEPAAGSAGTSAAAELFLERLAEAAPERQLNAGDLALAATICAAVDGVPLAIELAAARSRAFSLPEIADQVRADPSSLSRVGRGRGGPAAAGRQSVRMTVDRSVRLLTPAEQNLHAAMAVVPGPMTVRMAAALAAVPPSEAEGLVAGLVHRSLLIPDGPLRPGGPSRFAQLAIVRGHGAHALGEDGAGRVADRRDRFLVDAVMARPRMGMTGETELYDRLDDDLAALRATLHRTLIDRPSWAGPSLVAGLGLYLYYRGMLIEGARWIALSFEHFELARPADAAIMHSGVATLHLLRHDVGAARPHLDALIAAVGQATGQDLLLVGDQFAAMIASAFPSGDHELMGELAQHATAIADRTGDANSALLARVAALWADPPDPDEELATAVAVHAEALTLGNRWAGWMAAGSAVRACLDIDDLDTALEWSQRGMGDYLALGARDIPHFMELHGVLHARRGDDRAAVRFLAAARAQNRRASMHWPTRPETPAILEEAARRLGAATYERAWRDGSILHLADVVSRSGHPAGSQ